MWSTRTISNMHSWTAESTFQWALLKTPSWFCCVQNGKWGLSYLSCGSFTCTTSTRVHKKWKHQFRITTNIFQDRTWGLVHPFKVFIYFVHPPHTFIDWTPYIMRSDLGTSNLLQSLRSTWDTKDQHVPVASSGTPALPQHWSLCHEPAVKEKAKGYLIST